LQKIKLREATKEFKLTNKLALFFLEKNGVPVKSHSSAISMEQLEMLRALSKDQAKIEELKKEYKKFGAEKKIVKEEVTPEEKSEPVVEKPVADIKDKETKIVKKKSEAKDIPVVKKEKPVAPETIKPIEKSVEPVVKKQVEHVKSEVPKPPEKERKPEVRIEKPIPPKPEAKPHIPARRPQNFRRQSYRPHQNRNHRFSKGEKIHREKRTDLIKPKKAADLKDVPEFLKISGFVTLKELADNLNIKLKFLEDHLLKEGRSYPANLFLEEEDIEKICKEFNVEVELMGYEESIFEESVKKSKTEPLPRPPVVTVMGHVDHGKTTLLDTLRKTRVAAGEAGGITQSIGAYKLEIKGSEIVFIDTPGHEAFTNLRARGAKITDIVILVVAANDGVKPQTVEAINHARAAGVPIIVAINKIDIDGADPDKVKQELSSHNLIVEDWGGDTVSVEISAKLNKNLDTLLEMIGLVAEMQELKAYKGVPGWGTVIESKLDSKLGPLGTILIQEGEVKRGDYFICGNSVGKIRSLFDHNMKPLKAAERPSPVEVMGFEKAPEAGERFQIISDVSKAKKIIDLRQELEKGLKKDEVEEGKKLSLQNLFQMMDEKSIKEFPIILKTDNFGSGEILSEILKKMAKKELKINIVHNSIGNISESDILLASSSSAVILGFNVKAPQKVVMAARREGVEIKLYSVIYHLMEDLEKAIKGEIEPVFIESKIGEVEVLQKFKISKIGNIAGCIVKDGKVTNKSLLKVIRKGDLVFEGEIETLKRIGDEVKEVKAGTECGIKLKNFNSIEIGDMIEVYELKQKE